MITATKNLSLLSLDVLSYVLLSRLTLPRDRSKVLFFSHPQYITLISVEQSDGLNRTVSLRNLGDFIGRLYKKHPGTELTPIILFVLHGLEMAETDNVYIMFPLLQHMALMEVTDDPSDQQIAAQSGGHLLRQHAGSYLKGNKSLRTITRVSLF